MLIVINPRDKRDGTQTLSPLMHIRLWGDQFFVRHFVSSLQKGSRIECN